MPVCPSCQTELSDNDRFCPLCGRAVTENGPEQTETASVKEPAGIGGWLVVMLIGVTGSILINAIGLYDHLAAGSYVVFGINLCFVALAVICLIFMFRHSRHFPKLGIALYVFGMLINLLYYCTADLSIGRIGGGIVGSIVSTALWVAYLLRSKRVKNTFYY